MSSASSTVVNENESFLENDQFTTSTRKKEVEEVNPNEPLIHDLIQQLQSYETEQQSQQQSLIDLLQQVGDLARDEANRNTIGKMDGAIDVFISLLRTYSGQIYVENKILRVFANLAFYHTRNAEAICNVEKRSGFDVIELCVKHLRTYYQTEPEIARLACATMTNLCHDDDTIRNQIVKHGGIEILAEILRGFLVDLNKDDPFDLRGNTLRAFDNLSESEEALKAFLNANLFDILLEYLQNTDSRHSDSFLYLCKLSVKLLEIISVSKLFHEQAVKRNVVGLFSSLLLFAMGYKVEDEDELEEVNELIAQIVASLQGMVKCEANFTQQLFEGETINTIQLLIKLLDRTESTDEMREAVVELLALISEKDALQQALLQEGILEPIIAISNRVTKEKATVKIHHSKLLRFAIKILSFLALDNNNLEALIKEGAGNVLIETLFGLYDIQEQFGPEDMSTFQQMNTFILRNTCIGLGNLARTDDNCVALVKAGAVKALMNFLSKGVDINTVDMSLICNAAFSLSNLTKADGAKDAIVADGVIEVLSNFFADEVPFALQFYATESIANLAKNRPQHAQRIVSGADSNSSVLDKVLQSVKALKDQQKMIYAVTRLLVIISGEDAAIHSTVVNKLQSDPELISLIKEMQNNEDRKIQSMAIEAINKLHI